MSESVAIAPNAQNVAEVAAEITAAVPDVAAAITGSAAPTMAVDTADFAGYANSFAGVVYGLASHDHFRGADNFKDIHTQGLTRDALASQINSTFAAEALGFLEDMKVHHAAGTADADIWSQNTAHLTAAAGHISAFNNDSAKQEAFLKAYGLHGLAGSELNTKLQIIVRDIATHPALHAEKLAAIAGTQVEVAAATAETAMAAPSEAAAPSTAEKSTAKPFSFKDFIHQPTKVNAAAPASAPTAVAETTIADALARYMTILMKSMGSDVPSVTSEQATALINGRPFAEIANASHAHSDNHYKHLLMESADNFEAYSPAQKTAFLSDAVSAKAGVPATVAELSEDSVMSLMPYLVLAQKPEMYHPTPAKTEHKCGNPCLTCGATPAKDRVKPVVIKPAIERNVVGEHARG